MPSASCCGRTVRARRRSTRARAIVAALPPSVTPVGVFVDPTADEVDGGGRCRHPDGAGSRRRRRAAARRRRCRSCAPCIWRRSRRRHRAGRRRRIWCCSTRTIRCSTAAPARRSTGRAPRRSRRAPRHPGRRPDAGQRAAGDRRRAARTRVDVASGVEARRASRTTNCCAHSSPRREAGTEGTMAHDEATQPGSAGAIPTRAATTARSADASCPRRWSRRSRRSKREYLQARQDPAFAAELTRLLTHYVGRADAAVGGAAPRRGRRRRAHLPEARGPDAHRRAQDQQRARPGAARQAHGQDAHRRRDRRRPARRRQRHGLRAARPRVRRLHGHRRHARGRRSTSSACACSAPRSKASTPAAAR